MGAYKVAEMEAGIHGDSEVVKLLLLTPRTQCSYCLPVSACINGDNIAALTLLFLNLGAPSVAFHTLSRRNEDGRHERSLPARPSCRSGVDSIEGLYATYKSSPTLQFWLQGQRVFQARCSSG